MLSGSCTFRAFTACQEEDVPGLIANANEPPVLPNLLGFGATYLCSGQAGVAIGRPPPRQNSGLQPRPVPKETGVIMPCPVFRSPEAPFPSFPFWSSSVRLMTESLQADRPSKAARMVGVLEYALGRTEFRILAALCGDVRCGAACLAHGRQGRCGGGGGGGWRNWFEEEWGRGFQIRTPMMLREREIGA